MDIQNKVEINNCILAIKRRDSEAVQKLYHLVGHTIEFIARKYLTLQQDYEDLIQDFWADIYNIADGFYYFKNGYSYLSRFMTNRAINRYKQIYGEKKHIIEPVEYEYNPIPDVTDVIENVNLRLTVQKALKKLSKKERIIIQLIFFEKKTIESIAKEIDMPRATVGRIKLQALDKLKIDKDINDLVGKN